jgi:hypothetical protein
MAIGAGWLRKCKITIASLKVYATHTDFTVLLSEGDLPSEALDKDGSYPAKDDGADIRFSLDADGVNELAFGIRYFSTNNNPALALANIAVKISSLSSSTDTDIWVWYNNSSASAYGVSDTYGQYNAYNSDYTLVMPMFEIPDTESAPQDRTSYQNNTNFFPAAWVPADQINGVMGYGLDFTNHGDSYFDIADDSSLAPTTALTIEAWMNFSISQSNRIFYGDWGTSDGFLLGVYWSGNNKIVCSVKHSGVSKLAATSSTYNDGAWHLFTGEDNGSNVKLYVDNGTESITGASVTGNIDDGTGVKRIGNYNSQTTNGYLGLAAEIRLSKNVARGENWHKTTYENIKNPGTFFTVGTPESVSVEKSYSIFIE